MRQRDGGDGVTQEPVRAPLRTITHSAEMTRPYVGRNVVLSIIAITALGVTRLAYSVIVGHGAGRAALGKVNTDISVAMFVTLLVSAGTAAAAAKFIPAALAGEGPARAHFVLIRLTWWTTAGTFATAAGVFFCLRFVIPAVTLWDAMGTAALTAAYGGYSFAKGVLYGYGSVRRYAILEICADAVALAVVVLLVAEHVGSAVLLLPLVLGYGLFATAVSAQLSTPRRYGQPYADRTLTREMATFTAMNCVGAFASTGFLQLSMVFARHYGSAAGAGEYASALALTAPAYLLPRALTLAVFPAMAGAYGRGDVQRIRGYTDLATRVLSIGMLPAFLAAAVLARPLLTLLFGPAFGSGQLIFQLMLVATFVSIIPVAATSSLTAAGPHLVKLPMMASLSGLLVGVVFWITLGAQRGVTAVALGYLCGSVVQTAVPLIAASRHYHQRWGNLSARATVLCAVAAALWFWAGRGVGGGPLREAIATVAFLAVWGVFARDEIRLLLAPAQHAVRRWRM